MKLRPATLKDYNELVEMFKDLIAVVYKGFNLGSDIYYHGTVQDWFKSNKDIVICETKDGEVAGFTLAYVENIGIVQDYYFGDIAYVKPKFRKGRAAYLLYNNVVDYADQLGLPLVAKAFMGDDRVDKIQSKFGEPFLMEFKRLKKKQGD